MTKTTASVIMVLLLAGAAPAGPIDPPSGPVGDTMKRLDQVEPRTVLSDAATPGDAESVFLIDAPGSYYLAGNVSVPAGKHGIKITASNVTLDLGGFTVAGVSGSTLNLVHATTGRVMVRNGTLATGGNGVYFLSGDDCRIEDVTVRDVTGEGVRAGNHATVSRVRVHNAGSAGIKVFRNSRVVECDVSAGGTYGGIYAGYSSMITRSTAEAVAGDGITADIGSVVTECTARDCADDGFQITQSNVSACAAYSNDGDGFEVSGRSMVSDCYSTQNGYAGFRPLGTGVIRHCSATLNMTGIRSETGKGLLILENECSDNTGYGIWMNGATDCRIEGNQVYSNTGNGIYLNSGGAHLVIRNTGRGNGGANFTFEPSSDYGQILTNPGAGFASSNAWANFSY